MVKEVNPARGFGARYGVSVRRRWISIVVEMKKKHTCPQCGFKAVRRESVGIWVCKKCGLRFAGGAYTPVTKVGATAQQSTKST
ncbi:MAG: 50S ribosomal protein L37ae [Candidatus Bathyarchaeia archaeon]|nr:50S ribosomal protein L37ae [Candidatus Bathyarchaeota archaeon]